MSAVVWERSGCASTGYLSETGLICASESICLRDHHVLCVVLERSLRVRVAKDALILVVIGKSSGAARRFKNTSRSCPDGEIERRAKEAKASLPLI